MRTNILLLFIQICISITFVFSMKLALSSINKSTFRSIAVGFISLSIISPNLIAHSEEIPTTSTETSKLTAGDLLLSDIQPRVLLLKDIETSFGQYNSFIDARDYLSIRSALRQEPTVELRKTCKSLRKYLSSDKLKKFDTAYTDMISSVDDLDSLALRRTRDEGIPSKDKKDDEMINAVSLTTNKLDELIKIAE